MRITNEFRNRVLSLIMQDLQFKSQHSLIANVEEFARTLMTDEEIRDIEFMKTRIHMYEKSVAHHYSAEKYLGRYFRRYYVTIPIRLLDLKEFQDYLDGVRSMGNEYLDITCKIEHEVKMCNSYRDFKQRLPQFLPYVDKVRAQLGLKPKNKNLPVAPVDIPNLDKYLKKQEENEND